VSALRVGVARYLLNRPLTRGLYRNPTAGVALHEEVPSRLGQMLLAGELDVALAPMALLLASGAPVRVLPGVGVGCDGAVMSARLLHRVPLNEIRSVCLDDSSRSGALLGKLLLEGRLGLRPTYTVQVGEPRELLRTADAAVVIGDPALRTIGGEAPSVDLGALWKETTGLGYVFAMWAFREGLPEPAIAELTEVLTESLATGERELGDIVEEEAEACGFPTAFVDTYLGAAIRYHLEGAPLAGLSRALEDGRSRGFLPAGARLPEGAAG
jgi:chorismate dehydratase